MVGVTKPEFCSSLRYLDTTFMKCWAQGELLSGKTEQEVDKLMPRAALVLGGRQAPSHPQ